MGIGTMPNMNGKGWYEVKTSGTVGTKVLIQIPGSNKILSLAEVEVWGRAGGNGNGNAKKCTIAAFGNSGSNTKTATLPSSIYKCPSYVDKNTPWLDPTKWGDKFRVTQVGNKVTVKRLDYHGGWGQNLRFKCCQAAGGPSSTSGGNGAVSGPMVNLARGSHYTAQSSVAYNGPSARAVDGNHNSKWGSNSITHTRTQHNPWWSVDFKKLVTVYRVKVWNRLDCCSSRLSGAQVYVVNGGQKHLIGTMPNMNGKGWYEVKTSGTVGTKVLIQIPGSNKILSLAEVEVWGRAGGNGNGNAKKCTIAAFGNSGSNTKTATLPSSIYKCPSYVDKNTPWLDPTKWGDKFRVTQSGNRVTVKRLDYSGGWGQNLRFKCCQAAGGPSSTSGGNGAVSGPMVNLARGSHYTAQSSVAYNGPSARAVDGNHNSKWGSNSITHTRTQPNPWWSVDFKKLVTVYRVKVWNRLDCCSSRLSGAQVYVVNGGQKHLIGTMPNMNGKGWY